MLNSEELKNLKVGDKLPVTELFWEFDENDSWYNKCTYQVIYVHGDSVELAPYNEILVCRSGTKIPFNKGYALNKMCLNPTLIITSQNEGEINKINDNWENDNLIL